MSFDQDQTPRDEIPAPRHAKLMRASQPKVTVTLEKAIKTIVAVIAASLMAYATAVATVRAESAAIAERVVTSQILAALASHAKDDDNRFVRQDREVNSRLADIANRVAKLEEQVSKLDEKIAEAQKSTNADIKEILILMQEVHRK